MNQQEIRESLGEVGTQGDAESGIVGEDHAIIIYSLPWEGMREDQARQLTKEVFGLSTDEEALLATPEELEYAFEFDVD